MRRSLFFAGLVLALLVAPWLVYPIFLAKLACYTLFTLSFAFLYKHTGLFSFGHALFWGVGAYSFGLCVKFLDFSFELSLLCAAAVGFLLSLVLAMLVTKRSGIYFSMVTISISQLFYFLALRWKATGGEDGLQSVLRQSAVFEVSKLSSHGVYWIVLGLTAPLIYFLYRASHSVFGFSLMALQENEVKAKTLGYNERQLRVLCFTISGLMAAIAGALKVFVVEMASLEDLHWHLSGQVVLMTLLGGSGLFWGPALGTLIVLLLQNYVTGFGPGLLVLQGLIFIFCVIFLKEGILGLFRLNTNKWNS